MVAVMPHSTPQFILLMGVSGVGKTTIGEALAERLNYTFLDADAYHSAENRAKMSSGQPLSDADRMPWLDSIHSHVSEQLEQGSSIILACSALKESYRSTLLKGKLSSVSKVIWLDASMETLQQRTKQRSGHFMPASLLESQCKTLEAPGDALKIDANREIEHILQSITQNI